MERAKYPRTFHLPWSPGRGNDDRVHANVAHLVGQEVSVSAKLDGECTAVYSDGYTHARSTSSASHPSRNWIRAKAAEFAHKIPTGWRVYGENCFARHSIGLNNLPSFFFTFAVVTEENEWLSVDDTFAFCKELDLQHVPVLYRGVWDEKKVKECFSGKDPWGNDQEGYVVRVARSFRADEFEHAMAKYVRKGHVQTNDHWMTQPVIPNGLV